MIFFPPAPTNSEGANHYSSRVSLCSSVASSFMSSHYFAPRGTGPYREFPSAQLSANWEVVHYILIQVGEVCLKNFTIMDGERFLLILATFLSLPVVVSTSCPTSPFTNSDGSISSPGFNTSQSYGDNLACTYTITVSVNRRVILEFKNLSILGTMPDCEEDSLEIFVG